MARRSNRAPTRVAAGSARHGDRRPIRHKARGGRKGRSGPRPHRVSWAGLRRRAGPRDPPKPRVHLDAESLDRGRGTRGDRRFVDVEERDGETSRAGRVDGSARGATDPVAADDDARGAGDGDPLRPGEVRRHRVDAGRSVPEKVTLTAWSRPGTSSTTDPSGRSRTGRSRSPGWQLDRRPGLTASVGACDPPSSSPVRLASRIGNATWSGRSDLRGSNARTAVGRPARVPVYRQRRAGRAGDHGPRPRGQRQLRRRGDVASSTGRRSGGSARPGRATRCRGWSRVPVDRAELARRGRPDGEDRRSRQRRRQGALEDDQVPAASRPAARPCPGTRPASRRTARTFGR